MRSIEKKTKRMLQLEDRYNLPIEEVLRMMYVDMGFPIKVISMTFNLSPRITIQWLQKAGIYSHKLDLDNE